MPDSPPATETQPTTEDVVAIGEAASTAAEQNANTPEQAGEAAAQAAQAEAKRRRLVLPQEVVDQIGKAAATATVAELASQRAIVPPEQEHHTAAQEPSAQEPAKPDTEPAPPKTLADRFLDSYRPK